MEHPDRTAAGVFTGADPTQARLREIDWTASALGPVSRWPVELCTALQIILASPMPMEIDWGPDLTRIFNDTARLNLGAEHLELLGRPWGEAWPDLREVGAPPQCLASMGVHASPTQLQTTLTDVDGEDPAAEVLATGEPKRITGLRRTLAPGTFLPNPLGPLVPDEAMVYSLRANIPSAPDGVLGVGISPYRRLDVAYRTFLDLAARHISVILTDARSLQAEHGRVRALGEQGRQSQEQTALTGNRTVSYAIGILMALSKVTVDDAFALLRACARSSNRKLGEVADDVVHTGVLPAVREAGHHTPPAP